MSDLTLLNCMYNFSLEMFMSVFKTTVFSLGNSYLAPDQEDVVLEFNFNTANRDRQLGLQGRQTCRYSRGSHHHELTQTGEVEWIISP